MKKISTEAKIGIIVIATLGLVIWGINFLKGENILNKTRVYYGVFENTQGIDVSASVLINGYKVGIVNDLKFKDNELKELVIAFSVDDKYKIPANSIVELHSADLLGTKALRIIPSDNKTYHKYGDTLISKTEEDMLATLTEEIMPLKNKAESAIEEIDSLISSVNYILNQETRRDLRNSISNLQNFSYNLSEQISSGGELHQTLVSLNDFTKTLSDNRTRLDTIFGNFESISDSLARANIAEMINSIDRTFHESAVLLGKVNQGEGSLGLLATNDSVYNNLNSSIENLDKLLEDLRKNPERYVQFSVFGGKNKEKK
jgi:phospholipid/cholesterol/gamma-HCH transport system substrate-binding protein